MASVENTASENAAYQEDEMMALSAILDPSTFKVPDSTSSGSLIIKVQVPLEGLKIMTGTDPAGITVKYLPPLALHFTLPSGYPALERPAFTLSCCWLDRKRLSKLCRRLDLLYEEQKELNAILFVWYSFLREDIFQEFGLNTYDVSWWYDARSDNQKTKSEAGAESKSFETDSGMEKVKTDASSAMINLSIANTSAKSQDNNSGDKPALLSATKSAHTTATSKHHASSKKYKLDPRAVLDPIPSPSLLAYLDTFNAQEVELEFTLHSHSCQICLSEASGPNCIQFASCSHVYCKNCVGEFFKGLIEEGQIDAVKCPGFGCKGLATHKQILALVGEELFTRYDRLLLQRTLDSMTDMQYCPRQACHAHVICDPNEKLAKCPACAYVFCSICRMVYHGVEPCRFKHAEKLRVYEKYMSGDETERKELEKAYGKKQLGALVETVLSEEWVKDRSKKCPHCQVPIEKFEGCNKVTCFKCNTYFCWNCSTQLSHDNPYFHFNDPASKCYNTLFEGVRMDGDDDDDDDDFFDDSDDDDF